MIQALRLSIDAGNVIVKKNIMGSVTILFKKRPFVLSSDGEVNLSENGFTSVDFINSNIEQLIRTGAVSLIFEER